MNPNSFGPIAHHFKQGFTDPSLQSIIGAQNKKFCASMPENQLCHFRHAKKEWSNNLDFSKPVFIPNEPKT